MNFNVRDETVRGYLILGVFFVHALWDATYYIDDWRQTPLSFALIKLISPNISIFFLLSGMSARNLGRKSFAAVLPQSLMLVFTAWASQGLAIVLRNLLYGGYGFGLQFIKAALRPMVIGTDGCDYITWFFTVLAVARLLGWLFERNKLYFLLSWLLIAALIETAKRLHLPDNLWEWRNWPTATLFLVIGMHLPRELRVPGYLALPALILGAAVAWFNAPGMWRSPPCLTCHMDFAAEPMVGAYGSLPVLLAANALIMPFMLWAGQPHRFELPGRIARFFGGPSLQFLLLHGWLLVTIEPLIAMFSPRRMNLLENSLLLLGFLVVLPAIHALAFRLTVPFLNAVLARCFEYGRRVTDVLLRPAGPKPVRRLIDG